MTTPITFTEDSYALFDVELNAVLTTAFGNLAIFSTKAVAEAWAKTSARQIEVRQVRIRPSDH